MLCYRSGTAVASEEVVERGVGADVMEGLGVGEPVLPAGPRVALTEAEVGELADGGLVIVAQQGKPQLAGRQLGLQAPRHDDA